MRADPSGLLLITRNQLEVPPRCTEVSKPYYKKQQRTSMMVRAAWIVRAIRGMKSKPTLERTFVRPPGPRNPVKAVEFPLEPDLRPQPRVPCMHICIVFTDKLIIETER